MEMDVEMQSMFEKMLPTKRETERLTFADARKAVVQPGSRETARSRQDSSHGHRARSSNRGSCFSTKSTRWPVPENKHGPDVSRQGVQRDLLPIVEGSTVMTKYGPVKTDHILFIAAGAFHSSKPSDLMPELQGRFPIRVELKDLTKEDFVRILREPQNALTKQQIALLGDGRGRKWNSRMMPSTRWPRWRLRSTAATQNIGARRLYTILEKVFETISFDAPDSVERDVNITADYVKERLAEIVKDEDLSKFIL